MKLRCRGVRLRVGAPWAIAQGAYLLATFVANDQDLGEW